MRNILILLLFLPQIFLCQSREIKGTVTDSQKQPLPGANISIKGTSIGTLTDFDGEFSLKIPDSLNIITISYIGFVSKEIILTKSSNTNSMYVLEEDISQLEEVVQLICYFDPRYIRINYYGGINHSGLGFLVEYFDPYTFRLPFKPEIKFGHQTNSKRNNQTIAEFNLNNLFRIKRRSFNIDISYNKIELESNFQWRAINIKTESFVKILKNRSTKISIGIGKSALNSENRIGMSTGFKHYLFKGFSINTGVTKWESLWQIQPEISWKHKNFGLFYNFNSIGRYLEHNIGAGYYINF